MKFNFKKIASVLAGTVMMSSTLAFAAAANYPAPFVKGGNADVAIVYGSQPGYELDLIAVAEVNANLQAALAGQTATGGSSSTGATASGGDSINLATASQKLYMNSSINSARTTLTSSELPILLADGTATDLTGTQYKYTQKITLGSSQITFSRSGESIDPIPMVNIGTTPGSPLFNYTVTFVKNLNVSDTTNVVGNAELNLLGQTYTIGANSDSNTLYLYGSGSRLSVDEGETGTATVNDVEHTVTLKGATSTTGATIIVDGIQKSVAKGSSYKFAGDFEVYVKDVYYTTKTGTLSNVDLLLGAKTLHFEDGQVARYGADDTSVTNSLVTITGSNNQMISAVSIMEVSADSTGDYLSAGQEFTDNVLNGAVKVQFAGLVPSLTDESRDKVTVETDNSANAKVKFTSDKSGKEYTLFYGHDTDGTSDSALTNIRLADTNNQTIHVLEGENVNKSDLFVINSNDNGRILKLTSVGPGTNANDKTSFQDVITGQNFDVTTGVANSSSISIDGETYYVTTSPSTSANITWGAGAAVGGVQGTQTTLFPRIKLKSGAWMSILSATKVVNGTIYQVPGADSLTTYQTGVNFTNINNSGLATATGDAQYNITWGPGPGAQGNLTGLNFASSTVSCNFNSSTGPTILIQEPKTVTGVGSSNGKLICIPLTSEGTSTVEPAIGTPVFSDGTSLAGLALSSDSTKSQAVDIYGTLVERDTDDNNVVSVSIPSTQAYADVLFTGPNAVVTAGSVTSGSVKELGSVMVSDSQVASVSGKNLIVVGGSCVNTLAAQLLGGAGCGADFESKTGVGAGSFLIQTFDRTGGKVATLVAGYNMEDTKNAAKVLMAGTVDTTAGKKYKSTSATTVSLVTA